MSKLNKNSVKYRVYNTLLEHEYMSTRKLMLKAKVERATLSSVLTGLRREGLIEYRSVDDYRGENGMYYKKHPENNPLHPPQPDLLIRKGAPSPPPAPVPESPADICERILKDVGRLRWIIKQQNKKLAKYEQIKHMVEELDSES